MLETPHTLVSIVVPYGGGNPLWLAAQLDALISSVGAWSDAMSRADIIVAANTPSALRTAQGFATDQVRVIDATRRRGPSAARNDGTAASNGDILLFCDADDVVDQGWVGGMVAALEHADLASGIKRYDQLNERSAANGWIADAALPTRYHHLPFAVSATLGIRRSVFDSVGGFDEDLECGEDLDLCWRAQYTGATISLADASVQYRLRSGVQAQLQQTYRYGVGDARLLKRHRPHGARRYPAESIRAAASLVRHAVGIMTGPTRQRSAYWVGYHLGHVVGTIRHRTWVV